jgi:5-methylthioadenosine/S-adenosylhomocysteine deaminase
MSWDDQRKGKDHVSESDRLIVRAGWVIPVDPEFSLIRNGEVVIDDGRVAAVAPAGTADPAGAAVLDYPRHALLPGLVNVHTHVAGSLFRGLTEDHPDGFYGLALPMERHLGAEDTYLLSRVGIAEVLLAGCTVIHEIYHHMAATARAAAELGVRAQLAHKVFDTDLSTIATGERAQIPAEGERRLQENIDLYDAWHGSGDGRVQIRFGAHAADTVSPGLLARIRAEAEARGAGRHIHVAQSPEERDFMAAARGTGSIEFLQDQGFLGPDVVVAHVVYATGRGIELLAETDTPVAHCPAITAKRGRFARVQDLYAAGIRVGWGTDWVTMDPWDMMRFGISGARIITQDIAMLSAREALWRTTMGSADALGIADSAGSLEARKQADLILVNLDQPHFSPLHDPVTTLVYNASGRDVTDVMIGGRFVVKERQLQTGNTGEIVQEAQAAAEHIWAAGGLGPVSDGLATRWPLPSGSRTREARHA